MSSSAWRKNDRGGYGGNRQLAGDRPGAAHLANEPVVASARTSPTYRLRKFVRRSRWLASGSEAAFAATLIFGTAALLAIRAEASRVGAAAVRLGHSPPSPPPVATARQRIDEAWLSTPTKPRLEDAAINRRRHRRAPPPDESTVAGEQLSAQTRADLTAARQQVEDLARHSRILVTGTANMWQFADDLTGQDVTRAEAALCTRQREAFAQFGLDPLAVPPEEAARTLAASRLRRPPSRDFSTRVAAPRPRQRLPKNRIGQVIARMTRRLSGGAYDRWQSLLDSKDSTRLVAFAASPDGLAFYPSLVGALGRDLSAALQFPACLTYLRAATERYPHDPWLHFDLSFTCGAVEPPIPHEALRHLAAACALRPESALFQLQLGDCYSTLEANDLAVPAYLKSIELYPDSARAYEWLGLALAKKKDVKGAIAAFKESARLSPNAPRAIRAAAHGLMTMGRPAEAVQTIVDALGRFPAWADNPRLYLRYNAACAAVHCADGKGPTSISTAERQTYRKQALDLLAADLVTLSKLGASDQVLVRKTLRIWRADSDLESVRPPRTAGLPPEERNRWEELWASAKSLSDSTVSSQRSESR